MKSPQDTAASIARARTEGYAHNQNPPCLMTSEGLERMMGLVREGNETPERASALALLSIAASLVRMGESGGVLDNITQSIDSLYKLLSSLTDGDHPNNALRVVRYEG